MVNWRCTVCGYIYSEEKEGPFEEQPDDYTCPICGAPKSAFTPIGKEGEDISGPTVGDKICDQLVELGVKYIFGIPGDSILPLVDSIRRNDVLRFIQVRHEETAAMMASAYAKLTGELGVCLSIAGPGATNLFTGLVDAASDKAPVLALVGQVAMTFLGSESLQEIDEIEMFAPFTAFNEAVGSPSQAINLTTLAVKNAYAKQGVSMLSLPTDVLGMPLQDKINQREEHLFKQLPRPDPEHIEAAANLINKYNRLILFGGWGIRNCGEILLDLARKIDAPIATTTRAKGVIDETHELSVGVLGSAGTRYAAKAIKKADLIIVVGSGFRQRNLVPNLPIIQIDWDGVKIGKSFPVQVGIVSDAGLALNAIYEKVEEKKRDQDYFKEIQKLREQHIREKQEDVEDKGFPINPGYVIQAIKRYSDEDAVITVDSGDHTYWFYKQYTCTGEKTLMSAAMASMGFAFPATLASKIAYPKRQAIAVNGDGGFGMLMADFTTAVRDDLDVKVIVFNDKRLKNIKKEQAMYDYPEFGTRFVNPNFAEFAESCGGEGYKVTSADELDEALERAFKSDKPAIIDVLVDPEHMSPVIKTAD